MSFDTQKLFDLLPAIHRIRDAELAASVDLLAPAERTEIAQLTDPNALPLTSVQQDRLEVLREKLTRGPLKALLGVLAEQVAVLEEDLDQLYDDQFVETCAEWVVPYIGDLIGYRGLHGVAPGVASPRAEVAHTIAFRRRKGTAAVLEQLARDVTGWNARVVEFFQHLITTQYVNHVRLFNHAAPDLRRAERLEQIGTAFDWVPRSVDIRRIESGRGRHNIPNVGIFLWRLNAYGLVRSPAVRVDDRRHLFSPLGNNQQLFTRPETEDEITHLAEPLNVPAPITRRRMLAHLQDYYGENKSVGLIVDGARIQPHSVRICNLEDSGATWSHLPPDGFYAIDPLLGRIALPANIAFPASVQVDFHYGFSADMGGGPYAREASFEPFEQPPPILQVPQDRATIQLALDDLGGQGIVEITDSGRYEEALSIVAGAGGRIELRAADGVRPTLVLTAEATIAGGDDAAVVLNGLLIAGNRLRVPAAGNALRRLTIRHCTLVPGWNLAINGAPLNPAEASLVVESPDLLLTLERTIAGALRVDEDATAHCTDCIIDATATTRAAYADVDGAAAGGSLMLEACTVIGKLHAQATPLISNCILLAARAQADPWTAPVRVTRRQEGCVRFTYLPATSRVPRRFRCQPVHPGIVPHFTSLRYGHPGYCQVTRITSNEIRRGADDEGEMGAFHHLYQPQRETNLRVRLDEYLRAGLQAGIVYET
jgi:hypothetical protein